MIELLNIETGKSFKVRKPEMELYRGDVICWQDTQYRVIYKKFHPVNDKVTIVVRKEDGGVL